MFFDFCKIRANCNYLNDFSFGLLCLIVCWISVFRFRMFGWINIQVVFAYPFLQWIWGLLGLMIGGIGIASRLKNQGQSDSSNQYWNWINLLCLLIALEWIFGIRFWKSIYACFLSLLFELVMNFMDFPAEFHGICLD